jgi:hypothetical protein
MAKKEITLGPSQNAEVLIPSPHQICAVLLSLGSGGLFDYDERRSVGNLERTTSAKL